MKKQPPVIVRKASFASYVRGAIFASLCVSIALNVAQYRGVLTNPANLTYQFSMNAAASSEPGASVYVAGRQ